MIKIEDLLEQHKRYDLGDSWNVIKQPSGWQICYDGHTPEQHEAVRRDNRIPDEPVYFAKAIAAITACMDLKLIAEWAKKE